MARRWSLAADWARVLVLVAALAPSVRAAAQEYAPKAPRAVEAELPINEDWGVLYVASGDVWVANGDGTDRRKLVGNASAPTWSPDHTQLAFFQDDGVWVANADGTDARHVAPSSRGFYPAITWDPLAARIAFTTWQSLVVEQVSLKSTSPAGRQATVHGTAILEAALDEPRADPYICFDAFDGLYGFSFPKNTCPAWSPSGEFLAFARNDDIWLARRLKDRSPAAIPSAPPEGLRWPSWAWQYSRLAAVGRYHLGTNSGYKEVKEVSGIDWSPDGRSLTYSLHPRIADTSPEVWLLRLARNDGVPLGIEVAEKVLVTTRGDRPRFSPDGRLLLVQHQRGQGGVGAVTLDGTQWQDIIRGTRALDEMQPDW